MAFFPYNPDSFGTPEFPHFPYASQIRNSPGRDNTSSERTSITTINEFDGDKSSLSSFSTRNEDLPVSTTQLSFSPYRDPAILEAQPPVHLNSFSAQAPPEDLPVRRASESAPRGPGTLVSSRVRFDDENLIHLSPTRRKGWYNRRGDQLWTNDGGYRGATPGQEYPPDLANYPDYGEGWMNEEGVRIDMQHRLIPAAPLRSALKLKPEFITVSRP